jgi:hypothetical protein
MKVPQALQTATGFGVDLIIRATIAVTKAPVAPIGLTTVEAVRAALVRADHRCTRQAQQSPICNSV